MTNKEIIISNMAMLIENGTITPDNVINTWIGWKMRGFIVKKGERHIAEFPIWVKSKKKEKETAEETAEEHKKQRDFVLQNAYWFTDKQVERIKEKT